MSSWGRNIWHTNSHCCAIWTDFISGERGLGIQALENQTGGRLFQSLRTGKVRDAAPLIWIARRPPDHRQSVEIAPRCVPEVAWCVLLLVTACRLEHDDPEYTQKCPPLTNSRGTNAKAPRTSVGRTVLAVVRAKVLKPWPSKQP